MIEHKDQLSSLAKLNSKLLRIFRGRERREHILSSTPEKSLRLSLFDAFIYALMVGAGETYLPAYVLSVGLSEVLAGVITSLPMVSGAFLQLLSPRFLQMMGNHKRFVVTSVFIQALSFVPLVYFTVFSKPDFWVLFLILTLYWAAGLAASPAWIFWMVVWCR